MIWSIRQFSELDCLEPAQREAVLRRVRWAMVFDLWYRAALPGAMFGFLAMVIGTTFTRSPWLAAVFGIAWLIATLCCYQVILGRVRRSMRREIAAAFAGQRSPICFLCGYDLRGRAVDVCPECGGRDIEATRPAPPIRTIGRVVGRLFRRG